ncbi:MAG: putative LPS assembly protein LptD [Bacteroidota bacterium]
MNFSLNDKQLSINSEVVKYPLLLIFTVVLSFVSISGVQAQVERPVRPPAGQLSVKPDTIPPLDSLQNTSDTLKTSPDSVKTPPKKDIETTIYYSARDSINSNMQKKIIKLYGNAKIKYGTIELEADEIVIDYESSTITAHGVPDSTGRMIGLPIFKDGGQTYETHDMIYNFKTKRAKISEVVTKQGEGFIHGDRVYKNSRNELFSINNAYTTCDLAHPHFRIISKKSKAIPGDKIVSGPFYMEFMDVPTPLGFAFGIFPQQRKSQSGVLVPTYGEEKTRGFFLKNGGYYFDINDYFKLGITGDIYSKGSSAIAVNSIYKKRYAYNGSLAFNYTNNRLHQEVEDNSRSKDFRLTWSHSPQTKGTGRFSASVNAATSSFTTNNYVSVNSTAASSGFNSTARKMSSNVSYSKTFAGTPFSLGINMRHSQDLQTKQIDLNAPDLSFNMNNIYPFKNTKSSILQNLAFKLTSTATNTITTNLGRIKKNDATTDSIAAFNGSTIPQLFKNGKKGVKHSFPLGTSIKIFKYFTLSPSLSYDETWYFEKLDWGLTNHDSTVAVQDTIHTFNRIVNYSGSLGLTTRLYGTWINKNPEGRIKAIRHVMNPSVNYSFRPDFAAEKYDYFQKFKLADGTVVQKSRHEGFVYGGAQSGRSGAIGFSLGNTVEMKVRGVKDTIDRKVSLLNSLSISSSYNLLADSFKLAPFSLSANSNVLDGKININVTGVLDPYQYVLTAVDEKGNITQHKINKYVWQNQGLKLGQLSSLNFNFSTNLSPKGREKDKSTRQKISNAQGVSDSDKAYLLNNPDMYVDFEIPWNLRVNYTVDYSKPGYSKPTITQTIRFNGDLSLTEKWKVDFNSGFDFQSKQFTQSQFGIRRDLHCWQVSVNWVPFGRFQNYNFTIGIKSGMLRDLKLDRTRSFIDQL